MSKAKLSRCDLGNWVFKRVWSPLGVTNEPLESHQLAFFKVNIFWKKKLFTFKKIAKCTSIKSNISYIIFSKQTWSDIVGRRDINQNFLLDFSNPNLAVLTLIRDGDWNGRKTVVFCRVLLRLSHSPDFLYVVALLLPLLLLSSTLSPFCQL